MLSLLLLTIVYANHLFNIFPLQLICFVTIKLDKLLVFYMFSCVYCLFVRLLFIILVATRNGE